MIIAIPADPAAMIPTSSMFTIDGQYFHGSNPIFNSSKKIC